MLNKLFHTTSGAHFKPISPGRIAYGAIFILLVAFSFSPLQLALEQKTGLTWLFKWRGERAAPEDLIIVALNSTASAELKDYRIGTLWHRRIYADLINKLSDADAKIIVMDIAFREERNTEEDQLLSHTMANMKPKLVLFNYMKRKEYPTGNGRVVQRDEVLPIPAFAKHADAIGPFSLPKYPAFVSSTHTVSLEDGDIYASQPLLTFMLHHYDYSMRLHSELGLAGTTSLSVEAVAVEFYRTLIQNPASIAKLTQQASDDLAYQQFVNTLKKGGKTYINFYGPDRTIQTIDAHQVLEESTEMLTQLFKNKVVYIGYSDNTVTEQQDARLTVFSRKNGVDLSGVEISASVFSNLREDSTIKPVAPWIRALIVISFALLSLVSAFYWKYRNAALTQAALLCLYTVLSYQLFITFYIWLPIYSVGFAVIFCNIIAIVYRYQNNSQRILAVEKALTQYVPQNVAQKLSSSFTNLEADQQLVHGVCMMTDIKGYTRLSENTPPQELHSLMNRYYEALISEVEARDGVIANIVGDSLLALWIGGEITPELCQKACDTAFAIAKRIDNHPEFESQLPTCFAIHGGQFSLGNLGAEGHFEYSPVGDIINTTSRIEPINRTLSTQMLCSTIIRDQFNNLPDAKEKIKFRHVGEFPMRNKAEPFSLFTMIENVSQAAAKEPVFVSSEDIECDFSQGLSLLKAEKLDEALSIFDKILERAPSDGPSRHYLELTKQKIKERQQATFED